MLEGCARCVDSNYDRAKASSGKSLVERYGIAHRCRSHLVQFCNSLRRALDLHGLRQHLGRDTAFRHDWATERARRIDNNALARSAQRIPARDNVGIKFQIVKAWHHHAMEGSLPTFKV